MKTDKLVAVHNTKTPSGKPLVVVVFKGADGYEKRAVLRPLQMERLQIALAEARGRLLRV